MRFPPLLLLDDAEHETGIEERDGDRRAAAGGDAEHPRHHGGVEHGTLEEEPALGPEPDLQADVVHVQHLGALFEQYPLGQARRPSRVHEHGGVVLVGFGRLFDQGSEDRVGEDDLGT